MVLAKDRRNDSRRKMDIPITKQFGDGDIDCWTSDLSLSGIKIRRLGSMIINQLMCNIEIHLVPGSITTVIAAKRVWQNEDYEAYEFISASFAQQHMLEKMVGKMAENI